MASQAKKPTKVVTTPAKPVVPKEKKNRILFKNGDNVIFIKNSKMHFGQVFSIIEPNYEMIDNSSYCRPKENIPCTK